MKYLLDTDTVIYYLKGEESVKQKILIIGLGNIAISIITLFELYYGAYNSKKVDENIQRIEKIKELISVFGIDSSIFHHFGRIKSSLRKTGKIIGDFDLIIAVMALSKDMILVTNNIDHFSRVEGIVIENWYKNENDNRVEE